MEMVWGLGLSALVALAAFGAGTFLPVVGGPVFGILLGMVAAYWKRPPRFRPGIAFASKKVLQAAIILLGFEMNLASVMRTGAESLYVLGFTLAAAFLVAWSGSRLLRIGGKSSLLIGVGTAICGGSAIAAVAPIVEAGDEEVAHAISTIFLFNVVAVFLFPALGRLLGLSDRGFGMWAGTAINDTSSVVAAAYSYSDAAGAYATVVKLTRTLLIMPICLVLAFAHRRTARSTAMPSRAPGWFGFLRAFPWFVLGFLLASVIRTAAVLPLGATAFLGKGGKFLIIVAMSAIGLNTDLGKLLRNGWKPIALGLACWATVAVVSLGAQALTGAW